MKGTQILMFGNIHGDVAVNIVTFIARVQGPFSLEKHYVLSPCLFRFPVTVKNNTHS